MIELAFYILGVLVIVGVTMSLTLVVCVKRMCDCEDEYDGDQYCASGYQDEDNKGNH